MTDPHLPQDTATPSKGSDEPLIAMDGNVALKAAAQARADELPQRGRLVPFLGRSRVAGGSTVLSDQGFAGLRMLEAVVIVVCSLGADLGYHWFLGAPASFATAFWAVGLLASVLYICVMHVREMSEPLRSINSPQALRDVALVWLATIGSVTFFVFALKSGADISRGATLSFVVLGLGGLLATRGMFPRLAAFIRWRPAGAADEAIVIGLRGDTALDLVLNELRIAGVGVSGVFRIGGRASGRAWSTELAGLMTAVLETARRAPDGDICIAAGGLSDRELHDLIVALQVVPRAVRVVPSASIEPYLHFPVRSVGRLLAVEPQRAPQTRVDAVSKRVMDLCLGSVALLALSPVLLVAALAIKIETRGKVFFRQDRLGHRGVPFSILKFRTMNVAENGSEVRQASANDSRVTRVGRWLRRSSIDELPQLLNVIRGEMSLVGPRPHAVAHDVHYAKLIENYEIRQHVKPGITGWAQVNGLRGETADPELMRRRVEHDIWYARNAGLLLDMRILLLTVLEVFRQRNAH